MIYIDANIIYNAVVETELTEHARDVMSLPGKVTSWTAVNEAVYALIRKLAEERGKRSIYAVKELPLNERRALFSRAYRIVERTMAEHKIIQIPEVQDTYLAHQISEDYGLLPSDATILATVLSHGITKLATLDRDFEAVGSILELLPKDYWKEKV